MCVLCASVRVTKLSENGLCGIEFCIRFPFYFYLFFFNLFHTIYYLNLTSRYWYVCIIIVIGKRKYQVIST